MCFRQARRPAADAQGDAETRNKGLLDHQIEAIEAAFAHRDKHMMALRREVEKLGQSKSSGEVPDDLGQRLVAIEARLDEQERCIPVKDLTTQDITDWVNGATASHAQSRRARMRREWGVGCPSGARAAPLLVPTTTRRR